MKNLIKQIVKFASVAGLAVIMAACSGTCHNNPKHKPKARPVQQPTETVVFYQTYEDADINKVNAKMYTRSSHGGESKMGYIKFWETDAGLKMEVDLKDLRPGVTYTPRVYSCGNCTSVACCDRNPMNVDLPTLRISNAGRLQESFIIRGLTAQQLNNAKLYLERDGGYKAAWGTLR